jgi:hypothetical protein
MDLCDISYEIARKFKLQNIMPHVTKILAIALLVIQTDWPLAAQTVSIDTSPARQRQVIDGFGTCPSGTEASQSMVRLR